jgi:hypothetical protein
MSRIEGEMDNLLNNPNVSSHKKLALYQNLFHRYSALYNQQFETEPLVGPPAVSPPQAPAGVVPRQPIVPAAPIAAAAVIVKGPSLHRFTKVLSHKYRGRANLLLDHLEENPDINWNDKNEVVVDGKLYAGSNIFDMLRMILKEKTTRLDSPVFAIKPFLDALARHNVPKSAVVNKDIKESLFYDNPQMLELSPYAQRLLNPPHTSTPVKGLARRRIIDAGASLAQSGKGHKIKWSKY